MGAPINGFLTLKAPVDFALLEKRALPAVWVPDPMLVYAKDSVERQSHGAQHAAAENGPPEADATTPTGEALAGWAYQPDEVCRAPQAACVRMCAHAALAVCARGSTRLTSTSVA